MAERFRAKTRSPTLFILSCEPQWAELTRAVLDRVRAFVSDSNMLHVLQPPPPAADADDPTLAVAADSAVSGSGGGGGCAPFTDVASVVSLREGVESRLTRGGHVLVWVAAASLRRPVQKLFFFSTVDAVWVGGQLEDDTSTVGDATCATGVDAAARGVLARIGKFEHADFAASFDDVLEKEAAAAAAAAARAARLDGVARQAAARVCKVCGGTSCSNVRRFLREQAKALPPDEYAAVQAILTGLLDPPGAGGGADGSPPPPTRGATATVAAVAAAPETRDSRDA